MDSVAIAKAIKNIAKEKRISMKRLLEECGVNRNFIYDLEHKSSSPSVEKISIIANYLDVPIDAIIGRDQSFPGTRISTKGTVGVLHVATVAAGFDQYADTEDAETIEVPVSMLKGYAPEECRIITVKGNSMFPRFLEGDKVIYHIQSSVDSGTVAVVQYNGDDTTIKKVNYIEGEDWLELIPINPEYVTKRIENEDLELCQVYGLVIGLLRDI